MLHCKTFCRRGALLVLTAAFALTGCTAGLGSEPTVETDPAATPEAAPVLVPENQEDVAFTWMGDMTKEDGVSEDTASAVLEPTGPQMDKQTAANNAASLLASAGYSPEDLGDPDAQLVLGLLSRQDFASMTSPLPYGSYDQLWPDADALYVATYIVDGGPYSVGCMFDAITGKAYLITCSLFTGLSNNPFYPHDTQLEDIAAQMTNLSQETLDRVEPTYEAAVAAANAIDPAAFVEQLMPQLGWQVETMDSCTSSPWPDTFAEYWKQSMGGRLNWQWLDDLRFTTQDGSHWSACYDTSYDRLLELVCLGREGSVPEGLVRDRYLSWYLLKEGVPVPDLSFDNYLLQGSDGLWYDVTFLNGDDYDAFLQDTDFHAANYLDTMSWLAPGEDGYSYRLLGDGFPLVSGNTTEAAG